MPLVARSILLVKKPFLLTKKPLLLLGAMLLFWTMFDSIMSYIVPIRLVGAGYSNTVMGFIFASSSIIGALFDIFLSRFAKKTSFEKLYIYMFIFCVSFPLLMWVGGVLPIYLLAMAGWGIYYDLVVFGNYNFVSGVVAKAKYAGSFGVLEIFQTIGLIIGPLIAGFFVTEVVRNEVYISALIFLFFAFIFFLLIIYIQHKKGFSVKKPVVVHSLRKGELRLWFDIGKQIYPLFIIGALVYTVEAYFWTLGPILAESLSVLHPFGGLVMSVYYVPTLITGLLIGRISNYWGKKKTAFISLFFSGLTLLFFLIIQAPAIIIAIVFLSSFFTSLVYPSLKGTITDYISEAPMYEKEIEGITDLSTNVGYVVGPLTAGFLSDKIGIPGAFYILGIVIMVAIIILGRITPKKIILRIGR